jgi:hypothetical protein
MNTQSDHISVMPGVGTVANGRGNAEPVLWVIIAILAFLLSLRLHGPLLSNDSFQYLSEARNLRDGNGLSTSIIHFDIERRSGIIPAPLTTFPPGFAIAIATLSWLPFSLETAAILCSGLPWHCLVGRARRAISKVEYECPARVDPNPDRQLVCCALQFSCPFRVIVYVISNPEHFSFDAL